MNRISFILLLLLLSSVAFNFYLFEQNQSLKLANYTTAETLSAPIASVSAQTPQADASVNNNAKLIHSNN